ncbi:unnamed protein product, partial [Rotaria sordida]
VNHYQITLQSGSDYPQTRGTVTLTLNGKINTVTVTFDDDQATFKRGSVASRFIPLTVDIGEVTSIEVSFKKTTNLISSSWYSSSWTFTKAIILNGDNQNRQSFCPSQSVITSGSKVHAEEFLPVYGKRASDICYHEYGCFTTSKPFGETLQ